MTVLAVSTSLVLKLPTAVPVKLTVSPVKGLPSLLVGVATAACNTAVPLTTAVVSPL